MSSSYLGPRNKPGRLKSLSFSLKLVIDKNLGASDKVILPEHVINEIMREFANPPNPIIFEIHSTLNHTKSKPKSAQLHCGVLEFTADPKTVRVPYWMTYCLINNDANRVKEGDRMRFRLIRALEPAKFAKFRPLDKRFARDIQTPRASLEHALRKFTVLTAGQRIPIIHDGRVYPLKVEDVAPYPAAHLIDTNLQVEFAAHDDTKNMDEEADIKGLIEGGNVENKDNNDDDEYVEVEEISLYGTISATIKENKACYYKVKIGNPNFGIRFVLNITNGDGNMYIHYDYDKPSIANHQWYNETQSKKKIVCIGNDDERFNPWFYIGIHSYLSACEYQFTVDQDMTEENTQNTQNNGNALGSSGSAENKQTEIPDDMQLCANCGKLISKQSFMMHSMRCANINIKCEICDCVMAKSMKSTHIHCKHWSDYHCMEIFNNEVALSRHISLRHCEIECGLCKCKLFPNQIRSHQEHECTLRKIKCSFCGMKLKYIEMEQHETYCGSLTIECELCGEMVTRKWLQNHLASEHNINPTLQTNLVNTIIHSNLGLDQNMDWDRKENEVKGLDDNDDDDEEDGANKDDLEDLDPFVKDIKRQLSKTASLGDVTPMDRAVTNPKDHDKINEDEEEEYEDDVYEFKCPFCQKHPPKTQDFGEHLATCSEKQMNEDSD